MALRTICILGLDDYAMLTGDTSFGHIGGESVQHVLLARAWRDLGLEVSLIVYDHGQPAVTEIDGIRVVAAYRPQAGLPGIRFFQRVASVVRTMRHVDADVYYQSPAGMLTGVAVWFAGIVIRFVRRIRLPIEEWIAVAYTIAILCAFMRLYGDVRYLFPVEVLAILFAPYSAYIALDSFRNMSDAARGRIFMAGIAVIALAGAYQIGFHSYLADSYASTSTDELASYMGSLPASTTVFFYNATNAVPFFKGRNYYQRIVMFEKWRLGSDFGTVVGSRIPEVLLINSPSKDDRRVSLNGYTFKASFDKIMVYTRSAAQPPR